MRYGTCHILLQVLMFVSYKAFIFVIKSSSNKRHNEWFIRLRELGVVDLQFQDFSRTNIVYLKVCVDRQQLYVGMSTSTTTDRELSRLRKFKQLSLLTYKEPCFSYWSVSKTFYSYICFPIFFANSELEARVNESELILQWKAALNVPFAIRRQKQSGMVTYKSRRSWRLLHRYRTKTMTGRIISMRYIKTTLSSALHTLHWIGGDRCSFATQQVLRHHAISSREIYRMLKLSQVLEEPRKGKARAELKAVLVHRELAVPGIAKPLLLRPLASPEFKGSAIRLLKSLRKQAVERALPYHLPPASVIETAWPSIGHRVLNFRRPPKPVCFCDQYREKLPTSAFSGNGHLVLDGQNLKDTLQLTSNLVFRSHKEAKWPSSEDFFKMVQDAFAEYWKHHFVHPDFCAYAKPQIDEWAQDQWNKHCIKVTLEDHQDISKGAFDQKRSMQLCRFSCKTNGKWTNLVEWHENIYKINQIPL